MDGNPRSIDEAFSEHYPLVGHRQEWIDKWVLSRVMGESSSTRRDCFATYVNRAGLIPQRNDSRLAHQH